MRGNVAATAYVDATVQRGFTENMRLTVRYDFDCVGNFSINLSPPLPITAAGPVSTPYHGRRKLIFAGLSARSLRCIPAITAVNKGLDAYVAVDACGTFSETKRQMGLLRMMQAGVILSDYAALMIEVLKDNGRPQAGAVYGAIDMDWAK